MDKIIKDYPKATFYGFGILLTIIGSLSLIIMQNNTTAMQELRGAIHEVVKMSQQNKADISNHEGRIGNLERYFDRP